MRKRLISIAIAIASHKRQIAVGVVGLTGVAGVEFVLTGCDATYYGGYSVADGQYWRSRGICNTMVPYGALVTGSGCLYTRGAAPQSAVSTCMNLAVGAFPSQNLDSYPAVKWLAALCGSGTPGYAFLAGYFV